MVKILIIINFSLLAVNGNKQEAVLTLADFRELQQVIKGSLGTTELSDQRK